MSKIYAYDDFSTGNWSIDIQDLDPYYADLFIGFTDQGPVVEFKNLKFGFELQQGENIKRYGVYPPPNVRYVRSDQQYITVDRLTLRPDQTYNLYLWCENDGTRFERSFEIVTTRPAQPFESWTWNGDFWMPPIEHPTDGKIYDWDESTLSWVEITE